MRGIRKAFPGVVALDGVSFACRAGEIHALCGENGAGKSTLMKVLGGVYAPDAGEILVDGAAVRFAHPAAARAAGISIIHQELSLLPDRTRGGEHPSRHRAGAPLPAGPRGDARRRPVAAGPPVLRPRPGHAGARPDHRRAADGGDRQGAGGRCPHPGDGRADRGAGRRRGGAAAAAGARPRRPPASPWSTSRTGCRRCSPSPTPSPC